MKLQRQIPAFILLFLSIDANAQSPASGNSFPSSGVAAIASTTNASYKLSVNGAIKLYGTGLNAVTSPTLFLQNTTASTGRHFGINSTDAGALQIFDVTGSNATRFLINNTGNIGIGTISPNNKLEIDNTTVGTSGLRFTRLNSSSTAGTSNGKLLSVNATGDVVLNPDVWNLSGTYINNNNSGNVLIGSSTDNGNKFQVTGNSYISGNLGIGITAPISPLQVNGNLTIGNSSTNAGVVGTAQITAGGASPIANRLTFGTDGTGWKFAISKNQAGTVTDYLTIQDNGLIGIGTTSPGYNLDVTGTGRFTSSITGNSFIKSGGTASQFLKADGTVDANSYITGNQSITASGDATGSGTTSLPLTLATVNSNVGSFTNANITVDAKGRITAASNGSAGSGITGSGTTNYLSKFTGSQSLGNSVIYENTGKIGMGTTAPGSNLEVKTATGNYNTNIISASGDDLTAWNNGNKFYSSVIKSQVGITTQGYEVGGLTAWNDANLVGMGLTSQDKLICNYGHNLDYMNFLRLMTPTTNLSNFSLEFKTTGPSYTNPSNLWHFNPGGTMISWNAPLTIGSVSIYPVRIYSDPGNANKVADIFIQYSKVGIGTETPTQKLDVNGNIYSNGKIAVGPSIDWTKLTDYALAVNGSALFNRAKVKLYNTWPDYVFQQEYKLPSLEEIEKYIKANQHLPEVPSAAEIEKNGGVDIGDTQTLLLKKIEEMTLLLIEQDKRIKALEKKLGK